ncbi:MAG: DUF1848 domain-containing protein [Treponema sp.]|jgi:hypothetical protein|nr:DUF1848 domain-containing protein [Treponema sp.]
MIISVSRRCDIPRFGFDGFLKQLDAGFADVPNPFNHARIRRVSLLPADVDAFVFWTRDPRSVLEHGVMLEERGYRFYVMVTLTDYPAVLEPNPPDREAVISAMEEFARRFGPARIIWRYDPVLLSTLTDPGYHRENFTALARSLNRTVERVIISLYDGEYGGAKRRIRALEDAGRLRMLPGTAELPEVKTLLADLAAAAGENGMIMQSCAEAADLSDLGIMAGSCIDGALLSRLWGINGGARDKNQRPHCRCVSSADIGSYGPCPAGCVYCYARR